MDTEVEVFKLKVKLEKKPGMHSEQELLSEQKEQLG